MPPSRTIILECRNCWCIGGHRWTTTGPDAPGSGASISSGVLGSGNHFFALSRTEASVALRSGETELNGAWKAGRELWEAHGFLPSLGTPRGIGTAGRQRYVSKDASRRMSGPDEACGGRELWC